MSYGMDTRVGICFQNSFGTSLTNSIYWLQPTQENVSVKKPPIVRQGLRGLYDEGAYQEGPTQIDGDVTVEATPNQLLPLLRAAMNRVTSVTSGSVRTHTFRPRTADFDTLSAEHPFTYVKFMGDTGSAHLHGDMTATNFELTVSNGELLTAKIGTVGGRNTQIAAIATAHSSDSALDWSVSSVSFGGTAKTNLREMTLTIENNIETKQTLSAGRTPNRAKRNGMRTININGTIIFDDQTEYQQFISQTEQRLIAHFRGTQIQSGFFEELTIDAPSFRFTEFPQDIGGPGEIEVSFAGACVYNVGSGNSLTVTLRNTQG